MNKKQVVTTLLVVAAFIAGTAYGKKVPVVATVAMKLPGAA